MKPIVFFVVVVALLFGTAVAEPLERNLYQFKNMINHKGFSSLDYIGYGCWCGWGNYGPKVFDQTDACCQVHDQCYERISGGFFGCSPKLVTYDWTGLANGQIVCTDRPDSCDRKACDCDRVAADCYAQYRHSYNKDYLDGNFKGDKKKTCN